MRRRLGRRARSGPALAARGRPDPGLVRTAVLAALAFAAAVAPAAAQAGGGPDPDRLLQEAADRYAELSGFCAEFVQVRIVPLLNQETTSRGTLCQRPPAHFLMDFSEPEGDVVVADGEYLWTYFPSVDPGRVTRSELGGPGGRTFDFHEEFLSDPAARFEAAYQSTDTVTGRPTHRLELRPRRPAGYERARLWLDVEDGLIRRIELVEENRSVRRVTLSEIRLNPELPPDRFRFTPPAGVQVIPR